MLDVPSSSHRLEQTERATLLRHSHVTEDRGRGIAHGACQVISVHSSPLRQCPAGVHSEVACHDRTCCRTNVSRRGRQLLDLLPGPRLVGTQPKWSATFRASRARCAHVPFYIGVGGVSKLLGFQDCWPPRRDIRLWPSLILTESSTKQTDATAARCSTKALVPGHLPGVHDSEWGHAFRRVVQKASVPSPLSSVIRFIASATEACVLLGLAPKRSPLCSRPRILGKASDDKRRPR